MHIFDRKLLLNLYAVDKEARVAYFENQLLQANTGEQETVQSRAAHTLKRPLQVYKDEPSLTLVTIAALTLCGPQAVFRLLKWVFPSADWPTDLCDIQLEKAISPNEKIMESIETEVFSHPVKYVREVARRKQNWEGPTVYDAIFEFSNKLNVFVEAKFTSDISTDTTHCTSRNQIARCIDVGLASVDDDLNRFFFLMLTPIRYQKEPGSRFYYFKMNQYREHPTALALDIPRLQKSGKDDEFLLNLSRRIGFLSFEECVKVILSNPIWSNHERQWLVKFFGERKLYLDSD